MSTQNSDRNVAIVTGGSRGIGLAIARRLVHSLGMKVVVLDIAEDLINELPQTFGEGAAHVEGRVQDVTHSESLTATIDAIAEAHGHIDVLVNNAGITRDGLLMRMSDDDWMKVIQINLSSAFYCTRAVAKHMVRQRNGSIVNISSYAGVAGNRGQANYSSSKAGMIGLTKTTAKELAAKNIRCNAVAPGFIRTDMTDAMPQKAKDIALELVPLKRMGEVDDIAAAVAFLASDDATYISGQVLCVDGAMHT
jgi:3-oxoacyl-[acyl-carrier protein] reductase